MIEEAGNLWDHDSVRCITTNGVVLHGNLVMGAGVALKAKRLLPSLPAKLGCWVMKYGNRAFYCKDEKVISFPTKHHWKHKSDIALILQSCYQVVEMADKFKLESILLPRPGCGNGGLDWSDVKPLIGEILDDRFIVLH